MGTGQNGEDQRKNGLEMEQHEEYETMDNGTEVNKANEMVLVTIREVKEQDKKIVYMVDKFSTYAQAEVVHSKKPETISTEFAWRWIKEGPGQLTRGVVSNSKEEIEELKIKEMTMEMD